MSDLDSIRAHLTGGDSENLGCAMVICGCQMVHSPTVGLVHTAILQPLHWEIPRMIGFQALPLLAF